MNETESKIISDKLCKLDDSDMGGSSVFVNILSKCNISDPRPPSCWHLVLIYGI